MSNIIHTIEKFNRDLLIRYLSGDCDIFTYEDFAKYCNKEKFCNTVILEFLECESKEDTKEISEKLFLLREIETVESNLTYYQEGIKRAKTERRFRTVEGYQENIDRCYDKLRELKGQR